jgi:DNA polymerase elongation subunit (family B)
LKTAQDSRARCQSRNSKTIRANSAGNSFQQEPHGFASSTTPSARLQILAEAHDFESHPHKIDAARMVLADYQESPVSGDVDNREVIVSKRIAREPRDYQKAGVTAIAAQQLFGNGVKLRPGQTVEYVITDSDSVVPNDRVRPFALWEGRFGYDRKTYAAMLREAFEPFILRLSKAAEENLLTDSLTEEELERFPLFTPLALLGP